VKAYREKMHPENRIIYCGCCGKYEILDFRHSSMEEHQEKLIEVDNPMLDILLMASERPPENDLLRGWWDKFVYFVNPDLVTADSERITGGGTNAHQLAANSLPEFSQDEYERNKLLFNVFYRTGVEIKTSAFSTSDPKKHRSRRKKASAPAAAEELDQLELEFSCEISS
jgi:hypothetical protein